MEELPRQAHDTEPGRPGAGPAGAHAELIGGPLDGLLLDVSGDSAAELREGAFLVTELVPEGTPFGPGARAVYRPRGGDPRRWDWDGRVPGAGGGA